MSTTCVYCKINEAPADMMPFCGFCIIQLHALMNDDIGDSHLIYTAECDECGEPFFITSIGGSYINSEQQRHIAENLCFDCMQIEDDIIVYKRHTVYYTSE